MDLSNLQQLVPAVAIAAIFGYVMIQSNRASEEAHKAKTVEFLQAMERKDERTAIMVNEQFTKQNQTMERLTSVLEKIDTKISFNKNVTIKK